MLERDVIRRAALGRHVLWVPDGEVKGILQARSAHAMAALELCGLVGGDVVFHADYALDPLRGLAGRLCQVPFIM